MKKSINLNLDVNLSYVKMSRLKFSQVVKKLIIGTIYRHLSCTLSNFEENFAKLLITIKARQKYVIFGDFNVDCNKSSSVPSIADYINHIKRLGCTQIINKPTRITYHSQTIIDHIYINSTMIKEIGSAVVNCDISDLQFSSSIKKRSRGQKYITFLITRLLRFFMNIELRFKLP